MAGSYPGVKSPHGLFLSVRFFTTGIIPDAVISLLIENGARHDEQICGLTTHCIVGERPNLVVIEEAMEIEEIPVVHFRWAVLSTKCEKLLPTRAFAVRNGGVFEGVVATASGLGMSDVEKIWAMLVSQGGYFRSRLDLDQSTHVICAKPTGEKYEAARTRPGIKIVTPDWVVDCSREKSLVDVAKYHPELLLPNSIVRGPMGENSSTLITDLGDDLEESSTAAKPSEELVQRISGKLPWLKATGKSEPAHEPIPTSSAPAAAPVASNHVVTSEPCTSTSFGSQSRPKQEVGSSRKGPDLVRKVSRKPRASNPQQIGLKNTGPAVRQQQSQIVSRSSTHAGSSTARFVVAQQQQVLHEPHPSPTTAVVAASEIPHPQFLGHHSNVRLPAEVCLLGCVFHIVGYDHIRPEIMAKYKERIKRYGAEICATMEPRVNIVITNVYDRAIVEHALEEGKRVVTLQWLNDVICTRKVLPPWEALHLPSRVRAGREKPLKKYSLAVAGFQGPEREKVRRMVLLTGAEYTGVFSKANYALICKKPDPSSHKVRKARHWGFPVVNVQWLSELVLGHMSGFKLTESPKYQDFSAEDPFKVDYSLVPELMVPWKSAIQLTNKALRRYKCDSTVPAKQAGSTGLEGGAKDAAPVSSPSFQGKRKLDVSKENDTLTTPKRLSLDGLPANDSSEVETPKIVFSASDEAVKSELSELVSKLGGVVVANVREATHLVMDTIEHTQKFFSAVAGCCRYIVTSHWIRESFVKRSFVREEPFVPHSEEYNCTYGLTLAEVMSRPNRSSLLEGKTFFLTPAVRPSRGYVRDVIEAAGGTVTKIRARGTLLKEQNDLEVNGSCPLKEMIIIACPKDYCLVDDVISAGVDMYSPLLVLDGVLGQRLQFEKFRLQPFKARTEDSATPFRDGEVASC